MAQKTGQVWRCFSCDETGHVQSQCPKGGFRCFACGEVGHVAGKCTKRENLMCDYCNLPGHVEVVCGRKRKEMAQRAAGSQRD
jgi:hypothetical protein